VNWSRIGLALAWVGLVAFGIWIIRVAERVIASQNMGGAFVVGALLLILGIVSGLVLGRPIRHWVGKKFAEFYVPDDKHFRIVPEYSVAEARVKQGRYVEAIAEYRKVIAQHPHDVYAHVQIAQLALDKLNDAAVAETELQAAFTKATHEDAIALSGHRLVDLYQHTLRRPHQALGILYQIRDRCPGGKIARLAEERIKVIHDTHDRELV
jgi:tetratricopeptide (TPR) repeat protein